MFVLVTYDVETISEGGKRRLRRVAKQCVNYGQRVQNSVFECLLDPVQFATLKHNLEKIIDPQKDSIRFYYLGSKWENKVDHIGVKDSYNPEDVLII